MKTLKNSQPAENFLEELKDFIMSFLNVASNQQPQQIVKNLTKQVGHQDLSRVKGSAQAKAGTETARVTRYQQ